MEISRIAGADGCRSGWVVVRRIADGPINAEIAAHFSEDLISSLWPQVRGRGVAKDDLIDTLAMLWSAKRFEAGKAKGIPELPEHDQCGLRMEIVY